MSLDSCLFCKILKKEIPSELVFENKDVVAFNDIYPQAKTHLLFIHRNHSHNINEMSQSPRELQDIFEAIKTYTESSKLAEDGFRVVTNLGPHGRQSVFHTHFHVLGGETLGNFGK